MRADWTGVGSNPIAARSRRGAHTPWEDSGGDAALAPAGIMSTCNLRPGLQLRCSLRCRTPLFALPALCPAHSGLTACASPPPSVPPGPPRAPHTAPAAVSRSQQRAWRRLQLRCEPRIRVTNPTEGPGGHLPRRAVCAEAGRQPRTRPPLWVLPGLRRRRRRRLPRSQPGAAARLHASVGRPTGRPCSPGPGRHP